MRVPSGSLLVMTRKCVEFRTALSSALMLPSNVAAVLIVIFVFGSNCSPSQSKPSAFEGLAGQLVDKFTELDRKRVIVMDSQPSFGHPDSFGAWLGDQLSFAFLRDGRTFDVVDRGRLQSALESKHLSPKDEWDMKSAVTLAKSVGATTLVLSSYGAAENGIGVSLTAIRVSEFGGAQTTSPVIGTVFGKIPLTRELSIRLGIQLDALRPKDGVYRSGYGGVSVPECIKCPIPGMKLSDVDLQGMLRAHPQGASVWLQFVVTSTGHTRDIKVVQPVGFGFDEQYVKDATNWEFKPAVDADNRPVPVLYDFQLSFNFK